MINIYLIITAKFKMNAVGTNKLNILLNHFCRNTEVWQYIFDNSPCIFFLFKHHHRETCPSQKVSRRKSGRTSTDHGAAGFKDLFRFFPVRVIGIPALLNGNSFHVTNFYSTFIILACTAGHTLMIANMTGDTR